MKQNIKMLVLLACVIVVCIDNVGSAIINYGRKCNSSEIDYGFRKNLWQHKAIHLCFPTPILNNNCTTIDANNGINCTAVGEDYFLQGGEDNRRAVCCNKIGMTLTNCSIAKKTFSFMKGFDIMYFEQVLRRLITKPSAQDISEFEVELCDTVHDTGSGAKETSSATPPMTLPAKLILKDVSG